MSHLFLVLQLNTCERNDDRRNVVKLGTMAACVAAAVSSSLAALTSEVLNAMCRHLVEVILMFSSVVGLLIGGSSTRVWKELRLPLFFLRFVTRRIS